MQCTLLLFYIYSTSIKYKGKENKARLGYDKFIYHKRDLINFVEYINCG